MSDIDQAKENPDPRACTCHPDDNPPSPCPRKFALTECRISALITAGWRFLNLVTEEECFLEHHGRGADLKCVTCAAAADLDRALRAMGRFQ